MGLLITIEANDGSGKETQSRRLAEHLAADGLRVKRVSFPNYDSSASLPVQMYLRGDFGMQADAVSPYAASVLFAVDRFASYKTDWQDFYQAGGIVIADRYTTANMLHQASKIEDPAQLDNFLTWLKHFEYQLMGIPEPDLTFFLDVPVAHSIKVIERRANKIDGSQVKDIHERDNQHLARAYQTAAAVGSAEGWRRITCMYDGEFLPIETIHQTIYQQVRNFIDVRAI